ncbi:MAG: preprotein translocase subunit YajC [Phaeodactylibacter sp.]|nr:preprotein translocase subunit YajC [Phaeodactylibacter sp.]
MGFIFLQSGGAGAAGMMNLVFIALIFVVFYFFMTCPQAKKQKEQRQFAENLEKGEEVVTASGIIGRINKIEGNIVTLEVGTKTYIRVTKNAINKEMTDSLDKMAENSN